MRSPGLGKTNGPEGRSSPGAVTRLGRHRKPGQSLCERRKGPQPSAGRNSCPRREAQASSGAAASPGPARSQASSAFLPFDGKLRCFSDKRRFCTLRLLVRNAPFQIHTQSQIHTHFFLFFFFNCKQVLKKRSKSQRNILKLLG